MDEERWRRVEDICATALERTGAARAAWIDEACGGDAELRGEVLALVEAADTSPRFLARPLVDLSGEPAPPDVEPMSGAIGPYRLLHRLGRGGMGDVYLAIRLVDGAEQRVALKVIRRGMDTDDVLARFRRERRILASLQHPNIARFVDTAATADGRPCVVMEYVEGIPLDEYCARHRLDIAARLALFEVICGAVQHAHQNLVVHRDLKPRNILVTEEGSRSCSTSASARCSPRRSRSMGPTRARTRGCSRHATRRRSRSREAQSPPPRTCTASACCCTNCSPARTRSMGGART